MSSIWKSTASALALAGALLAVNSVQAQTKPATTAPVKPSAPAKQQPVTADTMFARWDKDKNNALSLAEFKVGWQEVQANMILRQLHETFIAMDLESLVKNLGHNVVGVARTHADAVALAKNKRPGLILADIQLADGSSGLDAVNELLRTFEVPVVFITAYPERFLTGERPEPAFLISKPFQPAMVSAVASQALFFERNSRGRTRSVA